MGKLNCLFISRNEKLFLLFSMLKVTKTTKIYQKRVSEIKDLKHLHLTFVLNRERETGVVPHDFKNQSLLFVTFHT